MDYTITAATMATKLKDRGFVQGRTSTCRVWKGLRLSNPADSIGANVEAVF